MYPWNCCRTCLSIESLNPIFSEFGNAEKYSDSVFATTGLLVAPNDYLPQQMCSKCIDFINQSKEFRKKAIKSHKELLKRLQTCTNGNKNIVINYDLDPDLNFNQSELIKVETCMFVDEKDDVNRSSDDDDVTLNHFKSVNITDTNLTSIKSTINEVTDKHNGVSGFDLTTVFKENDNPTDKKKEVNEKKTVKRKSRIKKTDTENKCKEKKERVKETIECEVCHKILTSKLSIRNHYKIHTGFDVVCEVSTQGADSADHIKHLSTIRKTQEFNIVDNIEQHCGKKFITRRLLMQHCRAKHGYEKTDKCSYCDYRASNAEQVKIHERLHTGEKPYKCPECDDAFHRRSSYLQHIATHLKEKTVQCTECPKRFKSATLMHIHRHHRHRPRARAFRCDVCARSFARRRNLARHAARLHAHVPPPAPGPAPTPA